MVAADAKRSRAELAWARLGRVFLTLSLLLLTLSCADSGDPGFTYSVVLAEVGLVASAAADGTVVGLDLDDRIDTEPAPETCEKLDFTDPNGVPGIDNQLSLFGPTLALFGGDPAALIQGAINEGSLLILVEFEGLNSFDNDSDVTVRIHFGEGPTDVGNDGLLVPGQSFDIKPDTISVEMRHARIINGHMDASSFETVLPVAILDQRFNLPIFSGRLSIDFDEDSGEITGILGGAVPVETLIVDLISEIPGGEAVLPIASRALRTLADLVPNDNGTCDRLSTAMTIHGVTAFVLPASDTTN